MRHWCRHVKNLSGAQRWVAASLTLTAVCLVVGLIAVSIGASNLDGWCQVGAPGSDGAQTWEGCTKDTSSLWWGGALAAVGLVLAGMTCLAGAIVWTLERLPVDR